MAKIDRYFLLIAGLMLLAGVALGIQMAGSKDYLLTPVHAHANLVGWVSMALFGLFYRAYPLLKDGPVAKAHFATAAVAAILMPYGIYRAVVLQAEPLALVSALIWLAAVILFLVQVAKLVRSPAD